MNNPLKNLNGMTRTIITAVVVSSIMSVGSTVTAVRVMETEVEHIDNRLERHEHIPWHSDVSNRVGNVENRTSQLEVIATERQRTNDTRWERVETELRAIREELHRQRNSR